MKNTPGPWKHSSAGMLEAIHGSNGQTVLLIRDGVIPMPEDRNLILAAPDLLEACKASAQFFRAQWEQSNDTKWWGLLDHTQRAIAKAEGTNRPMTKAEESREARDRS